MKRILLRRCRSRGTSDAVTVKDAQAKELVITKSEIVLMKEQPTSLMPEGLEKAINKDEFVDLITFLRQLTAESSSQPPNQ